MRLKLFSTLIILLMTGCEPMSVCRILNDTNEKVSLLITPPVLEYLVEGIDCSDKLVSLKLGETDSMFECYLHPGDTLTVYGNVGSYAIDPEAFPYHLMILFFDRDSLILDSKEKIVEQFERNRRIRLFRADLTIKLSQLKESAN